MSDQASASEKPTQPDAVDMPIHPFHSTRGDWTAMEIETIGQYGRQCFAAGEAKAGAEVAALRERVRELEADNNVLTRECGSAEDESGRLEEELEKTQDENDRLRTRAEQAEAESARLRGLAKWASGRLIDAGDAESAQQVLDLAGQGAADDSAETIAGLRRFAQRVMESWPGGDLDGGDLQEIATDSGLLTSVMVSAPCGESCACAEYADSMPFACFRKTALLTGDGPVPAAEDIAGLRADAERYQEIRRGAKVSVVNGIGDMLTGQALDDYISSCIAARSAQATTVATSDAKGE